MITCCSGFLTVESPKNELVSEEVFRDPSTANAAMLAIFSQMCNELGGPYSISLYTGYTSDELNCHSTDPNLKMFYNNKILPGNEYLLQELWSPGYKYIYGCNAIIEQLGKQKAIPVALSNQLIGEAKFIRAFWHFYLLNFFDAIPLIISTDYTVNSVSSRFSKKVVYQQIINDLRDAAELLTETYVAVDGISKSETRVRPNRWVAYALLSRVYLYNDEYSNAVKISSLLIDNNPNFRLLKDLNTVFLVGSVETIWSLQPSNKSGFNTQEGRNYILTSIPQIMGSSQTSTISDHLWNAFEKNDQRRVEWISSFQNYRFPYKYKVAVGSELNEYSVVLRLAEQYLIRSESKAQQGLYEEAVRDLNTIRNRSGLGDYSGPLDKNSILESIQHERQVELFTEWGHRWFDLRRTNGIDSIMIQAMSEKKSTWSSYERNYPIPQLERDKNPNLDQNNGY